jgi:hypothetical protein
MLECAVDLEDTRASLVHDRACVQRTLTAQWPVHQDPTRRPDRKFENNYG